MSISEIHGISAAKASAQPKEEDDARLKCLRTNLTYTARVERSCEEAEFSRC